jgi:hypothetical protein
MLVCVQPCALRPRRMCRGGERKANGRAPFGDSQVLAWPRCGFGKGSLRGWEASAKGPLVLVAGGAGADRDRGARCEAGRALERCLLTGAEVARRGALDVNTGSLPTLAQRSRSARPGPAFIDRRTPWKRTPALRSGVEAERGPAVPAVPRQGRDGRRACGSPSQPMAVARFAPVRLVGLRCRSAERRSRCRDPIHLLRSVV